MKTMETQDIRTTKNEPVYEFVFEIIGFPPKVERLTEAEIIALELDGVDGVDDYRRYLRKPCFFAEEVLNETSWKYVPRSEA